LIVSVSIVKIDEFAVVLQAITFCITITQLLSHISESNGSPTVKYAILVLLSDLITLSGSSRSALKEGRMDALFEDFDPLIVLSV
jgi:hypothetical protein